MNRIVYYLSMPEVAGMFLMTIWLLIALAMSYSFLNTVREANRQVDETLKYSSEETTKNMVKPQ